MMEDIKVFEDRESQVRSYCRKFPFVFDKALNDLLITESGEEYIDLNGSNISEILKLGFSRFLFAIISIILQPA